MKKPLLRTADGKRQTRSLDDLLKEAVSDETLLNLPGKGKPLDLKAYFAPGEEFRAAGKILKENNVLPPHLQERKDAEERIQAAQDLFQQAQTEMPQLRETICQEIEALIAIFPDRATCQAILDFGTWPQDYPAPTGKQTPFKTLVEKIPHITQQITRYNARIKNTIYRYLTCLEEAQENIENYHKRQLLSTTLSSSYNYIPPIDLKTKEQEVRSEFTPLPELPTDLTKRLRRWYRRTSPSLWHRLLSP